MKKATTLAALCLLIGACGSGGDSQVASLDDSSSTTVVSESASGADSETAMLEFAQCMRDNGIPEFPDPEMDENGNLTFFRPGQGGAGGLGDRDTLQAAFDECGSLVEGLIQDAFRNFDSSEFQDTFLEFAQCMRDNGIDMPDPDFSQGFGPGAGGGGGLFRGDFDPDDPAFQAAAETCQEVFGAGFGPGGFGGPPPGNGG